MKKTLLLYIILPASLLAYQIKVLKQGITGTVTAKYGNQMPSPDRVPSMGRPVNTNVYLYDLTNREQAEGTGTYFTKIQTKLVAKVHTDAKGCYTIKAGTGIYSIFVEDNGRLYANHFDGKGNINPVKVTKDSVTTINITISSNAVY